MNRRNDGNVDSESLFERGVVIISLDAEMIWGHMDYLDDRRFSKHYPDVVSAYERLLDRLCAAGIGATWLIVGGLTLNGCEGANDPLLAGLPSRWGRLVRAGDERSAPFWYQHSFTQRLISAVPRQEVGLHGGLTHLIWTDRHWTRDVLEWELNTGIEALRRHSIEPLSFSFTRNEEAHHELLAAHRLLCYRGPAPVFSEKMGNTLPGTLSRMVLELGMTTPPPVWPHERLSGLWNIPASLFLYPIGETRTLIVPLRTRRERVHRGVDAAIRQRGIFHFCLHPANLAESPQGFPLFDEILERFLRARDLGDLEILTMGEVATRMERRRTQAELPAADHSELPRPTTLKAS